MIPRTLLALAALAAFAPQLRAQEFFSYHTQCTPGSLRACSSMEVGFGITNYFGSPTSLFLLRLGNLQGLPGYESGPRALTYLFFSGLAGTVPPHGGCGDFGQFQIATTGNVPQTRAMIDEPNCGYNPDGSVWLDSFWDNGTSFYGCDLSALASDPNDPHAAAVDQTCGGSITFGIPLRGTFHFGDRLPSVTYSYRAFEDGASTVSTSVGCTTGVDCITVTPEPATILLMAGGLLGIGVVARRRKRPIA